MDEKERCRELTNLIVEMAMPLKARTVPGIGDLRYIDLDCPNRKKVAAQIHRHREPDRRDGRVLVIPRFSRAAPESFDVIEAGESNLLSGDFGPNKNWIRGQKNFSSENPVRAFFIPHDLLNDAKDSKRRRDLADLLDYARQKCKTSRGSRR